MKRMAFLLLCLITAPASAQTYKAKVVGVSDGDTVTVLTAEKKQVRIRLFGIDAPESGQDFGQRSKQTASDMAFGKEVTVRVQSTDRFGRTVAEIFLPNGRSLNREMVSQGMAWWYREFAPRDNDLSKRETEARSAKRGLWSQPNPIPPWDFRRGQGIPITAGVVGNRNSRVFHAPNCTSIGRMKESNRVNFGSVAEAEKAGFRRAGDCRP